MMKKLTEQEEKAHREAWNRYLGVYGNKVWLNEKVAFGFAFKSGLDYQQAEIERQDAVVAELQKRVVQLGGLLNVALLEAYQNEVVDTQMEGSWIGPGKDYADKEDWLQGKWAEWDEIRVVTIARAGEGE